jgi:hypothetical protein
MSYHLILNAPELQAGPETRVRQAGSGAGIRPARGESENAMKNEFKLSAPQSNAHPQMSRRGWRGLRMLRELRLSLMQQDQSQHLRQAEFQFVDVGMQY